ncbi:MAG: Rieske 2Fe-2S domain-containing protein [Gammaproteobacteria bacterium]|nr:Rieske 2Fe-2S domain-containing protein [Gammaproteobacteria bacterium]
MNRVITFGRPLPPRPFVSSAPDWQQSSPRWIERALAIAKSRDCGGWHVVDTRRAVGAQPRRYRIDGNDIVFWRDGTELRAAPDACPHLGASLSAGCVRDGELVCPWHGMRLGRSAHGSWKPLRTFDDGVLVWLQLPRPGETGSIEPAITTRPERCIDATVRMEAICEPDDVIANRLDPWHGVHYHPHSFRRLNVVEKREDEITVRVAFGVLGPLSVEVDARFHCPDARTIAMTIVAGDGQGSVVETHATPVAPGRTAIIETTLVTSDRAQFSVALAAGALLRPLIERAAARLWVEDIAYAERRYALRHG